MDMHLDFSRYIKILTMNSAKNYGQSSLQTFECYNVLSHIYKN